MKIRYSYLAEQFKDPSEIFVQIKQLLTTGDFTLGAAVKEFEDKFAKLIGAKYAVGVGSGTDAIKLSLKAQGVGFGDEVITTANTFIATVGAIAELGAVTKFVDCNANYVMDTQQLKKTITKKTKAIVPVHFTGEPVEMDEVMHVANKYGIPVVEDACQSILSQYKGKACGTFGSCGAFSLHPLKNLNVWGDGGIIVSDDSRIESELRLLRNHGLKNRDEIERLGYNSRLDTIQALVGNWLITDAEEITEDRIANAAYYDKALSQIEQITLPPARAHVKRVYHIYMFKVAPMLRDKLHKYLIDNGIEAKVHYPIPLYLQQGLKHLKYKPGDFPQADLEAKSVISLPVDQHLTKSQLDYVIERIKEFLP